MRKYHILFLLFFSFVSILNGQEKRKKFIGIEAGTSFYNGMPAEMEYIRGEMNDYSDDGSPRVYGTADKWHLGASFELKSLNNKFGFITGLCYTQFNYNVVKEGYDENTNEFFYLRFRQDGINTEYLRVNSIQQMADYVGIPLAVRIMPYPNNRVRLYFKLSSEVNYRIKTKYDFSFPNDAMEVYENEASKLITDPNKFFSTLSASVGISIGKNSNPGVDFEILLPSGYISGKPQGIVNPTIGSGFLFSVQLPF